MRPETRDALVEALLGERAGGECAGDAQFVEVGIGNRTDVAAGLAAAGAAVIATDVVERTVPDGVRFVRDDVTDPGADVYQGADAVYALDCPPELHRPLRDVARAVGADCRFTTLGTDPPAVPVERRTLPGETLFTARGRN